MYGTRRVAEGWQAMFISGGRKQVRASALMFAHPARGISVSVRGSDCTFTEPKDPLDWFEATLKRHYGLTLGGQLGPGLADDKEARDLNRVIR